MKNKIRILNLVVITAIYCFAIGIAYNTNIHSDFNHFKSSSSVNVISDLSEKLFYHTSQSENPVNSYNNLPTQNIKNQFTGLWAIFNINEQIFKSEYFQYTTFARNILTNHRKSDFIFPFHYFW